MKNEFDFGQLSTQQLLINKACLEDTLSIQIKCSGMLTQLKEYVLDSKSEAVDPTTRLTNLLAVLAQHKAEAKTCKGRLYLWDRQEQLIGITHEMVDIVSCMVTKVNTVLTEIEAEIEAEIALLSQLSKTFFETLDAVEKAFPDEAPQGTSEDRFEIIQNAPSTKTLQ